MNASVLLAVLLLPQQPEQNSGLTLTGGQQVASYDGALASPETNVSVTAEDLFEAADRSVLQGELDTAIVLLRALEQDPNGEYRAEARARIARLYIAKGDLRAAALWFQKLLDEKPNTPAIRVELSRVLASIGDQNAAERQLRRAAATPGLPADVSRALGQINAGIRNNAPLGASFQIGIAPNSNINRATSARQVEIFGLPFELNPDGRAQSGVGLTFNSSAFLRHTIDATSRFVAQVSVDGDVYKDPDFNKTSVIAGIGPEIKIGRILFYPAVQISNSWLGISKSYDFLGVSALLTVPLSQRSQLTITSSVLNFDYENRSDLSGPIYSLGIAQDTSITPQLSARLSLTATRTDANQASNSTDMVGTEITLSRDTGQVTLFGRLGYSHTKGAAPNIVFGTTREDDQLNTEIGLIFRRSSVLGLSPVIRAKHTRNRSSLVLYDFESNGVEVALTKTF